MNWIWLLLNDFKWDFIIYCFIYQLRVDMHPQSLPLAIASFQNICKNGEEKKSLKWHEFTKWVSLHMHPALVFIQKHSKEIPCKEMRTKIKNCVYERILNFLFLLLLSLWFYGLWIQMNKFKIEFCFLICFNIIFFSSKQIKHTWKINTQCLENTIKFKEQHMNRQRNLNKENKINSRII